MKFLLAAINAKYIHSNLGVYSLKAYAEQELGIRDKDEGDQHSEGAGLPDWDSPMIEIGEYTINNQRERILADIFLRQPDIVGLSCYIWNIEVVNSLIRDLHKVLPETRIWLGGPEVSYDAAAVLLREPTVTGIMTGEGEAVFTEVVRAYAQNRADADTWKDIPGVAYRDQDNQIIVNPVNQLLDMDKIPFSYEDLEGFDHRIIYYESSRGCPFSCSYCLSSIDKSVRFRSVRLVKQELQFFLDKQVKQVKFVDRTFNCNKRHAMEIWQFIRENDNGITNFHFEISADLLDQEELELIHTLRPGLIQLEIGVQTTNELTIKEIRRNMDLSRLKEVVLAINQGQNVHQHLDLIAGLPGEGYDSFRRSFCAVYEMHPEQLQLGFLKVLKGSYMETMAESYGLQYRQIPPYEVLSTNWLSYAEVLRLKAVEDMVEVYYNSRQFVRTLERLETEFDDVFQLFESLAEYYQANGLSERSHSRLARYEILHDWIVGYVSPHLESYEDLMTEDLYLRENIKSRPAFALAQTPYKQMIREMIPDLRIFGTQIHVEVFRDSSIRRFDYRKKDPLTGNAVVDLLRAPEKGRADGEEY